MCNNRGNYYLPQQKIILTQREEPNWINKTIPKNEHNMNNYNLPW